MRTTAYQLFGLALLAKISLCMGNPTAAQLGKEGLIFLPKNGNESLILARYEGTNLVKIRDKEIPLNEIFRSFKMIEDFCIVVEQNIEKETPGIRGKYISAVVQVSKYNNYGDQLWTYEYLFTEGTPPTPPDDPNFGYGAHIYSSPELKIIMVNIGGIFSWGLDNRIEVINYDGEILGTLPWGDLGLKEVWKVYGLPGPDINIALDARSASGPIILVWSVKQGKILATYPVDISDRITNYHVPGKITVTNTSTGRNYELAIPGSLVEGQ